MADSLLDKINSPDDIKGYSQAEINTLCDEIRERLIETVALNGGHLASNLGVVELTVALHRVFHSPHDQIMFDVGHQCYTHKLLTGRRTQFDTLRTEGGLSGFPKPSESEHDPMIAGHSSTSISAACGLAAAKKLSGDDGFVIAVIGDGALTGGMAYEGLNNAGRSHGRLIVILNDNKMSISKNVGSMARYLTAIRTKNRYIRFKTKLSRALRSVPLVGSHINNILFRSKKALKGAILHRRGTIFEDMGFLYIGPVDGHNEKVLERTLNVARSMVDRPVLIHVCTVKGKGYEPAELKPKIFHGISGFDVDSGEPKHGSTTFSDVFAQSLCEFAESDPTVCAVTAAMKSGTGLTDFASQYRRRFFDVGIAEQHAVTFCAGMAANGMKPVFAVYSSFLQRAYDQVIHDVAIQNLNVTLAVDRAGIVGEDGETHQGLFDTAMLSTIPHVKIYCPAYFDEMKPMLQKCLYDYPGVTAIRYPRGGEKYKPAGFTAAGNDYDTFPREGANLLAVTYGRTFSNLCEAAEGLNGWGQPVSLLKLGRVKPLAEDAVRFASQYSRIVFFEEGVRRGGIGEYLCSELEAQGWIGQFRIVAVEDTFIPHAPVASSLARLGLDTEGMRRTLAAYFDNKDGMVH
ncbi:MAG: 1-deoxy-D-xylulose-5-phosphate synthase [Clostridia bacterium]|nr:1-deoxy-D-xylulose-5-phosphate synthase [Clostridia bacterium]